MKSSAPGKWQSRMRRSAPGPGKPLRSCRIHVRGSTPASSTRRPRSSTSTDRSSSSSPYGTLGSAEARENGSRAAETSWLPSTQYGWPSRSSSRKSSASPRRLDSRSPVTQTRSGSREATHSTARRVAVRPRDGTPRWKSDRCAMRTPSSAAGSSGIATSRTCARSQPASKIPQPPVAAARPATAPARPRCPVTCSDRELLDDRLDGDDVALELQLRLLQPGRDADQLRQVEDRHLEVLAGRLLQLRLPGVERQVAERARRDDRIGPGLLRLLDRLDQLAERRVLARLDDREPAALDLRRIVDRLAAAGLDDPLERPRPVGVLEAVDLRRAQDLAAVERRDLQPLQPAMRGALQLLVAVALGDLPEQVPHVDVALVRGDADRDEVLVDAGAHLGVALQDEVR